jgi:drug/metabolite transporter (DMT)-like permease
MILMRDRPAYDPITIPEALITSFSLFGIFFLVIGAYLLWDPENKKAVKNGYRWWWAAIVCCIGVIITYLATFGRDNLEAIAALSFVGSATFGTLTLGYLLFCIFIDHGRASIRQMNKMLGTVIGCALLATTLYIFK